MAVVPLRKIEMTVHATGVSHDFAAALSQHVTRLADSIEVDLADNGPRGLRAITVEVALSPSLRAALEAEGAFVLTVTHERTP